MTKFITQTLPRVAAGLYLAQALYSFLTAPSDPSYQPYMVLSLLFVILSMLIAKKTN